MVPDGYDTYQFLEASGWKDIADFSKLYIVMWSQAPRAGATK